MGSCVNLPCILHTYETNETTKMTSLTSQQAELMPFLVSGKVPNSVNITTVSVKRFEKFQTKLELASSIRYNSLPAHSKS